MSGGFGGEWGAGWGGGSGGDGGVAPTSEAPESLAAEEVPIAHTALALNRIAAEHTVSPKFMRQVAILGDLIQDVETVLTTIPKLDDPDVAGGVNLDVTGDLVGQSRTIPPGAPADDPLYRLMIKARIVRNASRGRNEDVIAGLSVLLGGPKIEFYDWGDMAIGFAVGRVLSDAEKRVLQNLDILPVSQGVIVNPKMTFDPIACFRLDTPGRGLGDDSGGSTVGGGKLADEF